MAPEAGLSDLYEELFTAYEGICPSTRDAMHRLARSALR